MPAEWAVPSPWFEDVTLAAGIDFVRVPAEDYFAVPDRMSGGVCVVDVDGVAPLDLFFAMRPSVSGGSRLYVGRAALDYIDETTMRGLSAVGDAVGCLAFDADGDGDDDLLVTGVGTLRLFRNDGGAFVDVSASLAVVPDVLAMYSSAAAGDVDGDGDLDLLIGGYLRIDPAIPPGDCGLPRCAVSVNDYEPATNLLLIRDAVGGYALPAAGVAPELLLAEPTLVVSIEDLDADGAQDLFVCNDLGVRFSNRPLLAQPGGAFADGASRVGLALNRRGLGGDCMGWSTADLDGDGRLDHVASSFEAEPTSVFLCGADGYCEDRADLAQVEVLADTFRWGLALADFNVDGRPDLFEATGHIHSDEEIAAWDFRRPFRQPPNLLINTGGAVLTVPAVRAGDAVLEAHAARGLAIVDLDDDGRLDVVLASAVGRAALLRNVHPAQGRYLRVSLVGAGQNRPAAGAVVRVVGQSASVLQAKRIGEGYLGNFDPRLLFALVEAGPVRVEVTWPDGTLTVVRDVALDTEITVHQP